MSSHEGIIMLIIKRIFMLLTMLTGWNLIVLPKIDYKVSLVQINSIDSVIQRNGKIVYVDMVGDLFHFGHTEMLRRAHDFGDYVILGLHGDDDCTQYKRTPILTLAERIGAGLACRYVDAVLPYAPLITSDELFDSLNIAVVLHGDDFNQEKTEKLYGAAIRRGIFKILPYTKGISTSEIIQRVLQYNNMSTQPNP